MIRSTLYSLYKRVFNLTYIIWLYNLHSYEVVEEKEKSTTNLQKSSLGCIIFRSSKSKNFASKCKLVHLDMITKEGSSFSFCLELVNWAMWNDKLLKYVYNFKNISFSYSFTFKLSVYYCAYLRNMWPSFVF